MKCYCGSGIDKELCCLRFIKNRELVKHPQELMRSRYSAYVLGDGRYLVDTTVAENRYEDDVALINQHAKNTHWLKLEIIKSSKRENIGFVEFKAYYKEDAKIHLHHEKSDFVKIDEVWFYEKGKILDTNIGRNESCPCGSGKKFKRCCA